MLDLENTRVCVVRSRNAEEGAAEERCPSLLAPIHEGGVEDQ